MIINASGHSSNDGRTRLIWENPSPANDFVACSITMTHQPCHTYYVMFYATTTVRQLCTLVCTRGNTLLDANQGFELTCVDKKVCYKRNCIIRGSRIEFGNGQMDTSKTDGAYDYTYGAQYIIPYRIYGIY